MASQPHVVYLGVISTCIDVEESCEKRDALSADSSLLTQSAHGKLCRGLKALMLQVLQQGVWLHTSIAKSVYRAQPGQSLQYFS